MTTRLNLQYGAVASGHQLVSDIGLEILRAGGNAFDAVVACGFASAVCEPMLSSLGGGGFLLTRTSDGNNRLFDFFSNHSGRNYQQLTGKAIDPQFMPITVNFPGSDQVFQSGMASIAVPGCLHGYFHVHRQLGHLPLRELVQPAIALAKGGVKLTAFQAYVHELLRDVLLSTPASCAIFAKAKGDDIKREGDTIYNPDLGDFMEILAIEGVDLAYRGEVAQHIHRDMLHHGGFVTSEDLQHYDTIERQPLYYQHPHGMIYGNPSPSFGSSLVFQHLKTLNEIAPTGLLDSDNQQRWLTSFKRVDAWRDAQEKIASQRPFARGTTHVSIIDKAGNCAAMTTSNGEGSGYIVPNTGMMLNNMMGEDDLHPHGFYASPAGSRIASMMAPTISVTNQGEITVLGSGGSKRIRSAITQVLWQLIKQNSDLATAIAHPRLHFDGNVLQCEPGFANDLPMVNYWSKQDMYFGGVHAVSNRYPPIADTRREGAIAAQ